MDRRGLLLTLAGSIALGAAAGDAQAAASISKVFVAGASGGSGKKAVQQLTAKGLSVRAGVRNVEKAKASDWAQAGKVDVVAADLTGSTESLVTAIGDAEAVICAVGAGSAFDGKLFDEVDRKGVIKLIDAAKKAGVKKFVLQTSILTNGKAIGEGFNPIFLVLNAITGALDKKLESEKYLRASGLDYTIVRPGGLKNDPPSEVGNLVLQNEDTLRAKKTDPGTGISRETVGAVLVEALFQSKASNRVVEIVASPDAPSKDPSQWF